MAINITKGIYFSEEISCSIWNHNRLKDLILLERKGITF